MVFFNFEQVWRLWNVQYIHVMKINPIVWGTFVRVDYAVASDIDEVSIANIVPCDKFRRMAFCWLLIECLCFTILFWLFVCLFSVFCLCNFLLHVLLGILCFEAKYPPPHTFPLFILMASINTILDVPTFLDPIIYNQERIATILTQFRRKSNCKTFNIV